MPWIDLIKRYIPYNNQEKKDKEMILDCINRFHDILYRNNELVHITSSAFVVNATRDKVLVVHHNIYIILGPGREDMQMERKIY